MDLKNKKILEALQMQPLSQEEMTSRHILGRMYGPIATCVESTRNGRLYNRELWEKALKDNIFLEKVATKALFLELGHPADREETDMKQTCACIPEVPKIVGDDLCAYVDILDTPNGRLLKTLVDYGFVPGISSRGSGDVMENNQVDPETFFLETWDIVQLPAVQGARLTVCESLNSNNFKLRKALAESYKSAKEEDKDTMKKALENLNIDIEEDISEEVPDLVSLFKQGLNGWTWEAWESAGAGDKEDVANYVISELDGAVSEQEVYDAFWDWANGLTEADFEETLTEASKKHLTADDIPWADDEEPLMEEMPADEEDIEESDEVANETPEEISEEEITEEEISEESDESEDSAEIEAALEVNESEETEEPSEEPKSVDVTGEGETDVSTIGDIVELLQEFDDDTEVEFKTTDPDGEVAPVDNIEHYMDNDVLVLNVKSCESEESSDGADSNIETETETEETPVETIEQVDETEESADDDGEDEVIESLKEMVRQKEALETELSDLRKAKAVGDAKEKELQEKLERYRTAFKTTSAEAAKVPELLEKVKALTEKLTQSNVTIKTLTEKVNKAQQLKESIDGSKAAERRLTEEVSKLTKKSESLEAKLEGQTKVYTEKLQERTNLAKAYKARFIETLTKYVESKANMLGVQPSEITSRLNENYTLADVDAVCDQILDSTVNFSRLPFSGRVKTSARIAESINRPIKSCEDDDLSDLYELAGLNK